MNNERPNTSRSGMIVGAVSVCALIFGLAIAVSGLSGTWKVAILGPLVMLMIMTFWMAWRKPKPPII